MDKQWHDDLKRMGYFDVGFDPFELLAHFAYYEVDTQPPNPKCLFDHVAPFFKDATKAIKGLDGRLTVEAVLGDYADVAETIQFGLYSGRTDPEDSGTLRPKGFPTLYDRIHLSNVP